MDVVFEYKLECCLYNVQQTHEVELKVFGDAHKDFSTTSK
jgi:hypothetical protein